MHRKEYEEAVAVLTRSRYPLYAWDSAYELQTARRLEGRYPEAILKYYLSGLGNLKTNAPRKEYTRKAQVMKKVHHVLVDRAARCAALARLRHQSQTGQHQTSGFSRRIR